MKTLPREPDQPKRKGLRDMDDGVPHPKAPPKEHPRVKLIFDKPHSQNSHLVYRSCHQKTNITWQLRKPRETVRRAQSTATEQDTALTSPVSRVMHGETLLFSRKKHLHKKKGLLEMDTVVAE